MTFRRIDVAVYPLILLSLYFIALFCYVVSQRIHYPLELEMIEGSSVNHALRILQGQPLYVKPAFEFTPNLYTPLFYYCGAALSYVFGIGFFSLRLVSLLAVVASVAVITLFVQRETASKAAAFIAGALYVATYAASGGWMDLARVDSLFTALLLLAVYWMRYAKNTTGIIISALLFVLAFYAKQSALIAMAPLMLYAVLFPRQHSQRFILPLVSGALLLFSLGVIDWVTDRWFTYYTIVMPAGHPNNSNNVREFWRHDLIQVMPVAIICACLLIGAMLAKKTKKDALFFGVFLFSMALVSYLTRINKGGYYNNLMPVYAALAIVFGIFFGTVITQFAARRFLVMAVVAATVLQFWLLSYDPRSYIPRADDWVESRRLIAELKSRDGNIYALDHGFIGYLAGKKNFSHGTSLGDIRLSRYQYWADTDLHAFVEQQMTHMIDGMNRNNVNTVLLINEKNSQPEKQLGDFVLKEHWTSMQYTQAWSGETFWTRSWSTRTMFLRPDILLYVRNTENKK